MATNSSGNQSQTQVVSITTEADFARHSASIPSSALTVIYFHAPWAAPCKQMSTVLETLASTYPAENPAKIAFLSLDAEEFPEISEKYEVTAVPFIVLQKEGEIVETISGSDPSKVRTAVETHAGKSGGSDKFGLPPAQTVTRSTQEPATHAEESKPATSNGVKNLSGYAPSTGNAQTAPTTAGEDKATDKEALWKRLDTLTKAAPVMLFMKGTPSAPQCGFSRQTVGLLRERSIRYGFFNILADDEVRQGLKEYADWPTFPQLWVKGDLVGGLDIVSDIFIIPHPLTSR